MRRSWVVLAGAASAPVLLLAASSHLLTGLGYRAAGAPTANDANHPAHTNDWVDTKLYFGLAPEGDTRRASSEAQWQAFLDREVTPRFPAGLSVIDVAGQWQGTHQTVPVHVRSKLLIIDYPNTTENAARIEAIRAAWKQRTHDQSVLKVTQPADVSF